MNQRPLSMTTDPPTTNHDHRLLRKATSLLPWKLRIIHLTEAKLTAYKEMHHTDWPRTSPWSHGYICDFMVALITLHLGNCFDSKKCRKWLQVQQALSNDCYSTCCWKFNLMNLYLQHCVSNCVTVSAHGYTCNNHCNLKSSCVACESKNVLHVARGQFRYLLVFLVQKLIKTPKLKEFST